MKQKCLMIILIITIFQIAIISQTSTARFIYWSPSAEATALGGAGVATINNSFAAYYNPASFGFNEKLNFSASFMQPYSSFNNTSQFMFSVSYPLMEYGTIALSLNSYWIDAQLRTSSNSPNTIGIIEPPKLFEPTNYQIKVSYANKLAEDVSIGLSASFLRIVLASDPTEQEQGSGKVSTILIDGGVLFNNLFKQATYRLDSDTLDNLDSERIHTGISIGFSLLNFGPKISYIDNSQKDPPPSMALLGLSYMPLYSNMISARLLIDFEKRIYDSDKLYYIHLGSEFNLYKMFSLRMGYAANNIQSQNSYFTYGMGIKYRFFQANISRYKKYLLPTWQFDTQISLGI